MERINSIPRILEKCISKEGLTFVQTVVGRLDKRKALVPIARPDKRP
jgi:hypothetical protein